MFGPSDCVAVRGAEGPIRGLPGAGLKKSGINPAILAKYLARLVQHALNTGQAASELVGNLSEWHALPSKL